MSILNFMVGKRRARTTARRALDQRPVRMEALEGRNLMSLLGIAVDLPITTVLNGTPGSLSYTAATHTLDDSATPIRFITATGSVPIVNNKDFELHIHVSATGSPSDGNFSQDVTLTGDVSLNNNNVYDYSGVLLTGKITQFGYEADGAVSLYDFRFTPTGGALMAPYFAGKDVGLFLTSEQSTFNGSFTTDFSGATKGVLGAINPITETFGAGDTATIGFWHNKNGQALLDSLNGGPSSTALGDWLAALMPNLYGATAGSNDLAGKSNAYIANFYLGKFGQKGAKAEAQILSAAFASYATSSVLAGGNYATAYGFNVNLFGTGTAVYQGQTIMSYFAWVNTNSSNGVLGSNIFNAANNLFDGINSGGDIS